MHMLCVSKTKAFNLGRDATAITLKKEVFIMDPV